MSDEQSARQPVQHRFFDLVGVVRRRYFQRLALPLLLGLQILVSAWHVLSGDWLLFIVSAAGTGLLLTVAVVQSVQRRLLRQDFTRSHALYLMLFWLYLQVWVWAFRTLGTLPATGKDSSLFYVFFILLIAMTFRMLLTLFALTPAGYNLFISKLTLWEQGLVAVNEFIAAGLLAFVAGGQLAQLLQPQVFSIQVNVFYSVGLLLMLLVYYGMVQVMWVQRWNDWLGKNNVWVGLARLLAPLALLVATLVIIRHFTRLSDSRTANLLSTASLDQTVLALSPVIWMMIFFIVLLVWSGNRGLKERFLPDSLLTHLPAIIRKPLEHLSDMDILLLWGVFSTTIPLQLSLFSDASAGVIGSLSQELARQNALLESSQQALALLFALPFYVLSVLVLIIYAYVLQKPTLPAKERDHLVERLPVSLIIIFIITLYLCAIPFSRVLIEGRPPRLPQELGQVLAFDVLIPLLLLYSHYFFLIRIPYGRGQSTWRSRHAVTLDKELNHIKSMIANLEARIDQNETAWAERTQSSVAFEDQMNVLYRFIELNGRRDHLNMERLRIIDERQELTEVSETPVSLAVARLPARVVSLGIPLLLAFKIYEWAVVNDGLREIASNPNIGVIEFFQVILEQTQF